METKDGFSVAQLDELPIELKTVRAFVQTGSLAAAAREVGLSVQQVRIYAQQVWWQQEVAALQRDSSARLDAELTTILDLTLGQLLQRLHTGDTIAIKTKKGVETRQVPLKADTLTRIADVVFTKRQLLRNQPTAIAGDTKKLNTLAMKLRALGAKDASILDVEAKDASAQKE